MGIKKEPLNRFIKRDSDEMFELFYGLMKGTVNICDLNEEDKIIWQCIDNECSDESGECYHLYYLLSQAKIKKSSEFVSNIYETIMKTMCRKIFFYGIKLGYILQERFDDKT